MQQLFFVTEPYETNEKNRENELQKKSSLMDDLKYAYENIHLRELLFISFVIQCMILMIQPLYLYVWESSRDTGKCGNRCRCHHDTAGGSR